MKIICLDYDGSYTEFPELFESIINKSKSLGYKVILATMRYENEIDSGLEHVRDNLGVELWFTGRKAKQPYLEAKGITPHLWIDDKPYWLLNDG